MARKADGADAPTLFDAAGAAAGGAAPAKKTAAPKTPGPKAPETAEREPLLLLMDGHAMVYRAWYAMANAQPLTIRATGEDVRGVYSFTNTFFKTLTDLRPTHVAIVFDPPGPTFRHEAYAEYKATRAPTPPALSQNVVRVKQVMAAFGVPVLETPGYEADDVLGAIAKRVGDGGVETIIATGDTEILKLVAPHVQVMLTTGYGNTKIYDEEAVRERYGGLEPDQQRDVKALTGDTSDNIPGVPGIGHKTAVKLIDQFGSVEALLLRVDEVTPPRIQGLVRDHADTVRRAKELVTIATDAPNDFDMDDARFGGYEREKVIAVFSELEFSSLVPRIPAGPGSADEPAGGAARPAAPGVVAATDIEVVDTPAALESLVKRLAAAPVFVFEAEASTPRAMEAGLVGLAFAVEEGHAYYVPVGHAVLGLEGSTQLPVETVMDALGPVLRDDGVAKAGHNLNFSMTLLASHGVRPTSVRVGFDSMIAAHLVGEKALALKPLAFNRLSVELTPVSDLVGTGRKQTSFDVVPIAAAASFAGANADITLRLMAGLEADLERDGLSAFNRDHAMGLVPVLVQMQVHGIAIDAGVLAELDEELGVRIEEEERAAYEAVAHEFAISSPAQVGELLFKELKLRAGRRTQSGYSTDASILEGLRDAHPVVGHVLSYRELSKLKSTYTETLPREVNPRTHRIHTTYNQAGSATGRLASSDPNLQNIPVRTDLGMRVRRAFIAEARPDWVLLSADYSQIDLRALAHLSQDPALLAAFERDEDIHGSTASLMYGVSLDAVTPDMRRTAKVMNFGVAYGLSAFGISRQTEMTREEGAEFIDSYFTTYARVREYLDETVRKAKETGYAETLLGRRRYLPELASSNFAVRQAGERMALNMPVQGTTSDIINAAMVQVQKRLEDDGMGSKMLLQVHDELIFETPKEEVEALSEMLREVMPSALDLSVPIKIDLKTGDNWADMS